MLRLVPTFTVSRLAQKIIPSRRINASMFQLINNSMDCILLTFYYIFYAIHIVAIIQVDIKNHSRSVDYVTMPVGNCVRSGLYRSRSRESEIIMVLLSVSA